MSDSVKLVHNPGNKPPISIDTREVDNIRFIGATHPLKTEIKEMVVQHGTSVSEILDLAQPDPTLLQDARVFIDGVEIPPDRWEITYPEKNSIVAARIVPYLRTDGINPLRAILSLVLIVATAGLAAPLGVALGLSGAIATAVGGALISVVGGLMINAIAPIRQPELNSLSGGGTTSPSLFIEGGRNGAHPFQAVPSVLGFYRFHPPLGAKTYTESLGDNNRFRMLLLIGLGPLELSDWKIGNTPIENFDDFVLEERYGYVTDARLYRFPGQVDQDEFSIKLIVANGWITRTSSPDADELSIDLIFPSGLIRYSDVGDRENHTLVLGLQYRLVGSPTWLSVPNPITTFGNALIVGPVVTLTAKRSGAMRHGVRWVAPARGQYEIRMQRVSPDDTDGEQGAGPGGSTLTDKVYWVTIRAFTNEDPIIMPVPVAKAALVIRATDQLSGVLDTLSVMVRSIVWDWNSAVSIWQERASNNPASLFRHVLQGPGKAVPVPDSEIDILKLQEWHEFCEDNGFTFNMVRDFNTSVYDVLADIAAAGRAGLDVVDGKWSVVIDQPVTITTTYINPRNSTNFQAERLFEEAPHAWRIRFPNEEEGFVQDVRTIYRDGYTEANATLYSQMEFPGVTNAEQIWKLGRYYGAVAVQRPERWTVTQDFESLIVRRGMRVKLAHDVLLVGLAYGRVTEVVIKANGDISQIKTDEDLPMVSGTTYGISIRRNVPGDVAVSSLVATLPGSNRVAIPISPALPEGTVEAGDLFSFGEYGQEVEDALVLSVVPQTDFTATITLVPYRGNEIYNADSGVIPPYVPTITADAFLPAVTVEQVISDGSIYEVGPLGAIIIQILVQATSILFRGAFIDIQQRATGTGEVYYPSDVTQRNPADVRIGGIAPGETWDLRVRWDHVSYLPGPWVDIPTVLVTDTYLPPTPGLPIPDGVALLEVGPTEPDPTEPFQQWFDTINEVMNQRNADNDAWMEMWNQTSDSLRMLLKKGADIPSAAILVPGLDGNYFDVTGNVTIGDIVSIGVGTQIKLHFDESLIITDNSPNLILPGGQDIVTQAGDEAQFVEFEPGNWRCVSYLRADGTVLIKEVGVGVDIPSSITLTIDDYKDYFDISGTTDISGFIIKGGRRFVLHFLGGLTVVNNANLIIKGGDLEVEDGDIVEFYSIGQNQVRVINYFPVFEIPGEEWCDDISNAFYTGKSYSIAPISNGLGTGHCWKPDGTMYYVVVMPGGFGSTTYGYVYQLACSTPWDVSTSSYAGKSKYLTLSGSNGGMVFGIFFKPDGLSYYVVFYEFQIPFPSGTSISCQYKCAIAWDISTSSIYNNKAMGAIASGLFFKPDGAIVYLFEGTIAGVGPGITQWNCSTPWDLTTATNSGKSFKPPGGDLGHIFFKPDGVTLYTITSGVIYQYTCTTPWDISTAVDTGLSYSIPSGLTTNNHIYFTEGGFYLGETTGDVPRIHQFDLICP